MIKQITEKIKSSPRLKKWILSLIIHPWLCRPRIWIRLFVNPFVIKKGRGAAIRSNTRIDILPFHQCRIGEKSVIENFSTINNGVGDIIIGNESRIGMGCTVIGPVHIGNYVQLAQNVVISGLNHNYSDPDIPISQQGVTTSLVCISDDVWVGANCTILAGVTIGTHTVIAAGSVVTKNIPPYSIAAGNPARIIKAYDKEKQEWLKTTPKT